MQPSVERYENLLDNDPISKCHKKLCDEAKAIKKNGELLEDKYQQLHPSRRYTPPGRNLYQFIRRPVVVTLNFNAKMVVANYECNLNE